MSQQNTSLPTSDQEIAIVLKEYEALRAEIISRLESQTQLTSVASILIGGVLAAIPFVFSFGSQKQALNIPPVVLISGLLAISTLFTSLLWTYMEHDIEMAYIGQYFNKSLRPKLQQLLKESTKIDMPLDWDSYRSNQLGFRAKSILYLTTTISVTLLSASRYVLISMPIVLSLISSIIFYISFYFILITNISALFDIIFFIFNVVYFSLALISCLD